MAKVSKLEEFSLDNISMSERINSNNLNNSLDRNELELQIGLNNRSYVDTPFTKLLNTPTVTVTYFKLNPQHSTFSEGVGSSKDKAHALKFDMIENFILYGRDGSITENNDRDSRGISQKFTAQEGYILPETIVPNRHDHILVKSNVEGITKLYEVVEVEEVLAIDKEVYKIKYEESAFFATYENIKDSVIDQYVFIPKNIGTQNRSVILKSLFKYIDKAKSLISTLSTDYSQVFWEDIGFDVIGKISLTTGRAILCYAPLFTFQNKTGVLVYDNDTTLFPTYPFLIKQEEQTFRNSIYYKVFNRKIKPLDKDYIFGTTLNDEYELSIGHALNNEMEASKQYNQYMFPSFNYTPKYDYRLTLISNRMERFSAISRFFNTEFICIGLKDEEGFKFRPRELSTHIQSNVLIANDQSLTSKYEFNVLPYLAIFDAYIDKEYSAIISLFLDYFSDYAVNAEIMDDMLLMPLLLAIVDEAIHQSNKVDKYMKTY